MFPTRKRIRLDHDDEQNLIELSTRFDQFCYPTEESSRVTLDDLYERLNSHHLNYRSSIELKNDSIEQEIVSNEEKLYRSSQSIDESKTNLIERKTFYKSAKSHRRHQADYETMARVIQRYPTREILQKKLQQLQQEHEQQKSELNHLNQRLTIYQKQSKVVLYSLLELVGFIDVKLPINFEDEIGRMDNNSFLDMKDDK